MRMQVCMQMQNHAIHAESSFKSLYLCGNQHVDLILRKYLSTYNAHNEPSHYNSPQILKSSMLTLAPKYAQVVSIELFCAQIVRFRTMESKTTICSFLSMMS